MRPRRPSGPVQSTTIVDAGDRGFDDLVDFLSVDEREHEDHSDETEDEQSTVAQRKGQGRRYQRGQRKVFLDRLGTSLSSTASA